MELVTALRDHLVAAAVVRKPAIAGPKPPLWLEPRLGVPAPGERPPDGATVEIGTDAVLGAFTVGGIPPRPYESFKRHDFVDIRLRTKTAPLALELERQIRAELLDKRNWSMGGMTIIESLIFREMQPLGSDAQSFDWVVEYAFERYA